MDEWTLWRRWLKEGSPPQDIPIKDGTVYGFYGHDHEFKRAAIFRRPDGEWGATLDGRPTDPARLLANLLRPKKLGTPTTHPVYVANRDNGTPWPKQAEAGARAAEVEALKDPGPGHNQPPDMTPDQDLFEKINELARDLGAEKRRIELKPELRATAETAEAFSRISGKALELFGKADNLRKDEKKPHLDAGRAIDSKWKRVTDFADTVKREAADMTLPYHNELRKQQAAQAAREAANRDAMSKDARLKRAAGVTTKMVEYDHVDITDIKALGLYFLEMKEPPNELVVILAGLAQRRVAAGVKDLPGITVTVKQRASN